MSGDERVRLVTSSDNTVKSRKTIRIKNEASHFQWWTLENEHFLAGAT